MPGYIHTCEKCGAHMQVHERYLGRSLKCTSCRTEFLAMLPADVEVEEPAVAEFVVPGPRRKWTRHLRWLVLLLPLIALVWWLGQDQSSGFGSSIFRPTRSFGELGVLQRDSDGPVVVALDPDSAAALARAGDDADQEKLRILVIQGRGFEMAAETRVLVLGTSNRRKVTKVRIISGPWESRVVWVPSIWIG